jgi:hypothetical protein
MFSPSHGAGTRADKLTVDAEEAAVRRPSPDALTGFSGVGVGIAINDRRVLRASGWLSVAKGSRQISEYRRRQTDLDGLETIEYWYHRSWTHTH